MTEHTIEDYEVVRELGQGGFGVVFEARSPAGERVAIKMLHEHLVSDSTIVQRFFQEALIMARLEHPAIPKVHHFGPYEVTHYLVQEFVEGRELEDVIGDKPMSPPEAVAVMEQLLDGLGYAHKEEIVHRDLKPANLILKEDGKLKILDFGIAKIIGGAQLTAPGIVNVTLGYASPEQLIGAAIDGRADIFAAGVLFHQLLTGEIPCKPVGKDPIKAYQAQIEWSRSERIPITRDHPELPSWVDAFYQRCTAPEAADRFVDAQAAREFLLASAPPADLRPRINRGPRRALTADDIAMAPATEMMDIEAASMDNASFDGPDLSDNKTAQLNIDDASTSPFDIANQATVSLDVGAAAPPQPLAITPPPPQAQAAPAGGQRTLTVVAAVLGLLVVAAIVGVVYLFMFKTAPEPPVGETPKTPVVIDAGS